MSSKTICPGMSPESNAFSGAFQTRTQQPVGGQTSQQPQQFSTSNKDVVKNKPIMGFLFSVSKTPMGEYWPLYIGQNSIGRTTDCSICLSEATVSDHHADLVIRKMHHNGEKSGVLVFIQDSGSTCGTMVNGNSLGFEPCECKNGDIITIGENYELYFVLLDADSIGIAPKEHFEGVEAAQAVAQNSGSAFDNAWARSPFSQQPQQGQPFSGSKGTIGGAPSPFTSSKTGIFTPDKK